MRLDALFQKARRLRSPAVSFADQLVASGGNFLTSVLIARLLGLEEFGWYTLVWIAVLLTMALHLGAVVSPMMSIGNKFSNGRATRYLTVVIVHEALFCAAAMVVVGAACALFVVPNTEIGYGAALLAGLAGGIYVVQDFMRRLLFTRGRPALALVIDIVHQGARNAALVLLLMGGGVTLQTVFFVILLAALVSILVALPLAGPFTLDKRLLLPATLRQWRSARWLIPSGLFAWLSANSAILVISAILGPIATGAVRAAYTIVGMLNVLREALENSLPQAAAREYAAGGKSALTRSLVAVSIAVFTAGAVMSAALFAYGETATKLIYGDDFAVYGNLLGWLSLTFPLALLNLTIGCAFRAMERTGFVFVGVAVAAAVNFIAIVPAVAWYGVPGAIAVVVAAELAMTIVFIAGVVALLKPSSSLGRSIKGLK
ncbi:MAG: polysaccharide biosynthesis C-terminal domain-containing protein [Pseudomonadota bacterium]